MHPAIMNTVRSGTHGDVFRDHRKFCAGLSCAFSQCRLARILMRELILLRHKQDVLAGGCSQGVVPLEDLQSCCGTFAVGILEEQFLLSRGLR